MAGLPDINELKVEADHGKAGGEKLDKEEKTSIPSVKEVKHSWQIDDAPSAIEVLSDGSVVLVTCRKEKLIRYSNETGEILYETKLENWAGGLAEVSVGGKQNLAVSFAAKQKGASRNARLKGNINFYDSPNLYKFYQSWEEGSMWAGKLCSINTDNTLMFQRGSHLDYMEYLDCKGETPVFQESPPGEYKSAEIQDFCCTKNKAGEELLACIYRKSPELFAYSKEGQLLWSLEGAVSGKKALNCLSVTADGHGHLFVVDSGNQCVQMFSTEGIYLGCFVSENQHDIGNPGMVRWCAKSSSVVISHEMRVVGGRKGDVCRKISILKVN